MSQHGSIAIAHSEKVGAATVTSHHLLCLFTCCRRVGISGRDMKSGPEYLAGGLGSYVIRSSGQQACPPLSTKILTTKKGP